MISLAKAARTVARSMGEPVPQQPVERATAARRVRSRVSIGRWARASACSLVPSIRSRCRVRRATLWRACLNLPRTPQVHHGGGKVEVALERAGAHAVVHVRDTGVGSIPRIIDRISSRSSGSMPWRNTSAAAPDWGLSIVRAIVTAHGGALSVQTEPRAPANVHHPAASRLRAGLDGEQGPVQTVVARRRRSERLLRTMIRCLERCRVA